MLAANCRGHYSTLAGLLDGIGHKCCSFWPAGKIGDCEEAGADLGEKWQTAGAAGRLPRNEHQASMFYHFRYRGGNRRGPRRQHGRPRARAELFEILLQRDARTPLELAQTGLDVGELPGLQRDLQERGWSLLLVLVPDRRP